MEAYFVKPSTGKLILKNDQFSQKPARVRNSDKATPQHVLVRNKWGFMTLLRPLKGYNERKTGGKSNNRSGIKGKLRAQGNKSKPPDKETSLSDMKSESPQIN